MATFTAFVSNNSLLNSNNARGSAFDSSGNLYVVCQSNNSIVKVTSGGTVSAFSISPIALNTPTGIVFDGSANLYVANGGSKNIIKIVISTKTSSVFATLTTTCFGLAFDTSGNLYVSGFTGANTVYKIISDGTVSTLYSGSLLANPTGVACDSSGNVYVVNRTSESIVKITSGGSVC